MFRKYVFPIVIILSMILTACGGNKTTEAPAAATQPPAVKATEAAGCSHRGSYRSCCQVHPVPHTGCRGSRGYLAPGRQAPARMMSSWLALAFT